MTIHKALHPRNDVDRLYVSRKEGGRWHANTEEASIQLEDYIKYAEEDWLQWPETIQKTQASTEQK